MTVLMNPNSLPIFLDGASIGVLLPVYGPLISQFSAFLIAPYDPTPVDEPQDEDDIQECGCEDEPQEIPDSQPGFVELRWSPIFNSPVTKYRVYKSIAKEPTYESKDELVLIAELPVEELSFRDMEGTADDYYAISTLDGIEAESDISALFKPEDYRPALCRIEGRIIDLEGMPVADIKVSARLVTPPATMPSGQVILDKEIYTLSGEDGFFSLSALKGSKVILEINRARVSDPIAVPDLDMVVYTDLDIYEEYRFQDVLNV